MEFWNRALRFHAPATIAGFIFFFLITKLIDNNSLLNENPILAIAFLVVITNFCAYLLYRSTEKTAVLQPSAAKVRGNIVNDNEVDGNIKLSVPVNNGESHSVIVENNEITKNKVKGDVVIGVVQRNE